ncbi:DUF3467 domain-containing protein [Sphingobacterium rhinopitheci]|uniref:DUF3467 domain-containing protein n=1 Tax=Sphingobacterium rhinopitheci TaxID=2781960 RepID=UPI001F524F3E|nr:DUF3467 domain-containing protein [Sphingobacterium rhinopitheci]MCI0920100.1 DUF3467 domain-containing protein [Sphingobacterium rhinopitheci]
MSDINKNNTEKNEISIELSEEIAEGVYANLAIVTHSNTEFVLDFIRVMPGVPKAKVKSRIVLTPDHAKALLTVLKDNIDRFDSQGKTEVANGPIDIPYPLDFGNSKGEA